MTFQVIISFVPISRQKQKRKRICAPSFRNMAPLALVLWYCSKLSSQGPLLQLQYVIEAGLRALFGPSLGPCSSNWTSLATIATLCCLIVTARLLLGPCWTYLSCWSIRTMFLHLFPSWLLFGWWFFKKTCGGYY